MPHQHQACLLDDPRFVAALDAMDGLPRSDDDEGETPLAVFSERDLEPEPELTPQQIPRGQLATGKPAAEPTRPITAPARSITAPARSTTAPARSITARARSTAAPARSTAALVRSSTTSEPTLLTPPTPEKSATGRIVLALVGFLLMMGIGGALATVVFHERVALILAR